MLDKLGLHPGRALQLPDSYMNKKAYGQKTAASFDRFIERQEHRNEQPPHKSITGSPQVAFLLQPLLNLVHQRKAEAARPATTSCIYQRRSSLSRKAPRRLARILNDDDKLWRNHTCCHVPSAHTYCRHNSDCSAVYIAHKLPDGKRVMSEIVAATREDCYHGMKVV